jgi:MFS family permease
LLNLRLLLGRNFGLGTLANFLLGTALYGSSFILPLYLSQIQGYNAEQIGEVLAWVGLPQLAVIPFVPVLMRRIDARLLVGGGLVLFAASNFLNIGLTGDVAGHQLFLPNVVRAVGQAMVMTPLAAIAAAGIAREDAGTASALFNMMRNLGGAIGIAGLQTFLTKREQFHSSVLTSSVSPFYPATRERIEHLVRYFLAHGVADPVLARREAIMAIGQSVRHQAFILGYSDTFFVQGAILRRRRCRGGPALRRVGSMPPRIASSVTFMRHAGLSGSGSILGAQIVSEAFSVKPRNSGEVGGIVPASNIPRYKELRHEQPRHQGSYAPPRARRRYRRRHSVSVHACSARPR